MEQLPADARAAPSDSEPNDTVMDIHGSPKRPREATQGKMVSQSATSIASVLPESQSVTTVLQPRAPARACQSLAHHTTPMGRCREGVGKEWEGRGGVTGRQWAEVSRRAAASVSRSLVISVYVVEDGNASSPIADSLVESPRVC
eukprot:scaffold2072_cov126-Isochrysis_galbana.AAC.11